jgi:hypothetical protein
MSEEQELAAILKKITDAVDAYMPPDGIDAKEALSRIIEATDNRKRL